MKTLIFVLLIGLASQGTVDGFKEVAIVPPTKADMVQYQSTIVPFMEAYTKNDTETAWKLGYRALMSPPYNFRNKQEFQVFVALSDAGVDSTFKTISREYRSPELVGVGQAGDWGLYIVVTHYEVSLELLETQERLICTGTESLAFHLYKGTIERFYRRGGERNECTGEV